MRNADIYTSELIANTDARILNRAERNDWTYEVVGKIHPEHGDSVFLITVFDPSHNYVRYFARDRAECFECGAQGYWAGFFCNKCLGVPK